MIPDSLRQTLQVIMGSARGGFLEPLASFLFGAHFSFSKEKCVKKKRFSKPPGTGKIVPYKVGARETV